MNKSSNAAGLADCKASASPQTGAPEIPKSRLYIARHRHHHRATKNCHPERSEGSAVRPHAVAHVAARFPTPYVGADAVRRQARQPLPWIVVSVESQWSRQESTAKAAGLPGTSPGSPQIGAKPASTWAQQC
jgi:hypothetical protein